MRRSNNYRKRYKVWTSRATKLNDALTAIPRFHECSIRIVCSMQYKWGFQYTSIDQVNNLLWNTTINSYDIDATTKWTYPIESWIDYNDHHIH
jgi:hypothetical protein